jgi:hypothetical protein
VTNNPRVTKSPDKGKRPPTKPEGVTYVGRAAKEGKALKPPQVYSSKSPRIAPSMIEPKSANTLTINPIAATTKKMTMILF